MSTEAQQVLYVSGVEHKHKWRLFQNMQKMLQVEYMGVSHAWQLYMECWHGFLAAGY